MSADGDKAASDAAWWGGFEKTAADIRDWSLRANRVLAWGVPGGSQVVAAQGAAYAGVVGAEKGGAAGAATRIGLAGADALSAGMATHLYDNDGNLIGALADKAAAYDPREYAKRLREAKKKFDKGEYFDAAGETLDSALDAADAAAEANRARKRLKRRPVDTTAPAGDDANDGTGARATDDEAASRRRAKEEAARRRKADEDAASRRRAEEEASARRKAEDEAASARRAAEEVAKRKAAEEAAKRKAAEEAAKRSAAEEEARRKATEDEARRKAAVPIEGGNEFEKGFRGRDPENPHIWVEDLDSRIKEVFNPGKHSKFKRGETPLIDKRLYNSKTNKAGFVSITASAESSGLSNYMTKFKNLLLLPFHTTASTDLLLKFLGYQDAPGAFVDKSSLWIPKAHEAKVRQAVGRLIFKNGAYDFTSFEDYVNHLRKTRPDLDTNAKIAKELLGKIQGRTPWAKD
jgi:hypothetical protein